MSLYSDYKAGAISELEFQLAGEIENRKERAYFEDMQKELYTDDPDDPHWCCENCKHCRKYTIRKRVIDSHPLMWEDKNGIIHKDESNQTLYITPRLGEFEDIWLCEVDRCEHDDTFCCEDFQEKEDKE